MRPIFLALSLPSALALVLVAACSDDASSPGTPPEAGADAPADTTRPTGDGSPETDAADGGPSTCALTRAYVVTCASEKELNCGPNGFDAWCRANDLAINSDAFRRAEAKCLTPDKCKPTDRRDCEYRSYATATATTAQKQLVAAYCATCEPGQADCAARHTTYDPAAGPKSVDDLFVAAWELSDPLVDEIRAKCTGSDAGDPDAGACMRAFAQCSGDVYLARLPDCPDGG